MDTYLEWGSERLHERYADLLDTSEVPHNPERKAQIAQELGRISFELRCRGQLPDESRQEDEACHGI